MKGVGMPLASIPAMADATPHPDHDCPHQERLMSTLRTYCIDGFCGFCSIKEAREEVEKFGDCPILKFVEWQQANPNAAPPSQLSA